MASTATPTSNPKLNADNVRVVLVNARNPLNIGAAARAVSNFGFSHLRLVDPWEPSWAEARSAVGAGAVMEAARVYATLGEAVADCSMVVGTTAVGKRLLRHPVRRLEYGARLLRGQSLQSPVAILFGSEKYGLSNEDMSWCQALMRIPTRPGHGSMNLGQAVAVCLYELVRGGTTPIPARPEPASAIELERLTEMLLGILGISGYLHDDSAELKIRRLVRRMELSAADAEVWFGILRQIRWKLDS